MRRWGKAMKGAKGLEVYKKYWESFTSLGVTCFSYVSPKRRGSIGRKEQQELQK